MDLKQHRNGWNVVNLADIELKTGVVVAESYLAIYITLLMMLFTRV